jgi:hypothetical protein
MAPLRPSVYCGIRSNLTDPFSFVPGLVPGILAF